MTRRKPHLYAIGFLVAVALTSGCTNKDQELPAASVIKTVLEQRRAKQEGVRKIDERLVQFQIKRALASGDEPLALMRISKTGSVALLRVIETNGPYRTWAAWGTTERRSVTTRGDVITATRGLGTDLMSSNVNGLLRMVTGLKDGIERQVLRHLDGENQIVETVADCAFTPDGPQSFSSGEIRTRVTRVDVFCKTETGRFNNYYLVSAGGRIVEAKTWLGDGLGYFTFSLLR
ncbi:YjbF family lipoprotein [Roseovarius aestuariivivens]|uniref:YjbF family lipoprotein n=1 Tax=Roseovarius aestuariivivens TaxID=1888910 RepID=UPI001081DDA7|nr:YjbF family lipoprotein [Roseovarius aestuariivivens]